MPYPDQDKLQEKARKYSSLKYGLSIFDTAYLVVLLFLFQGLGISGILARIISGLAAKEYQALPAYLLAVSLAYYLLDFPLNFYQSFVLEHNFGLSRQNTGDWFKDQLKAGLIVYIISLVLFGAFYYILRQYPANWWLIVSLAWIFFNLVMARLFPIIIIPLFFKSKPLSDQRLRQRIMDLAGRMKVKILDVFEIDFSKKTSKANAAFVGWGRTRRVLLADTLKDKYSHDEVEVILAHEFAHYRLKHLFKLILINSLVTMITFYLIFKSSSFFLSFFGLSSLGDIAAFPLLLLYFVAVGVIIRPIENYISRRLERNADSLALKVTGLKEAFISMMEKLALQNLADPNPSAIIKIFFFDHPPVKERIQAALVHTQKIL